MVSSLHPCRAPHCGKVARRTHSWCRQHERKRTLYGHCSGQALDRRVLSPFVSQMREFLDRYEGSPQVITATRVMQRLLDTGVSYNRASRAELSRLQDHGVIARQALEVCGGVWLLSHYDPRVLVDDDRLTYAMAAQLLKALPRPIRASHTRGGERLHYVPPSGLVRQHVGGAIRGSLGVFFRTVCDRLDTEDRARKEEAKILATPFTTPTRTALGQKP